MRIGNKRFNHLLLICMVVIILFFITGQATVFEQPVYGFGSSCFRIAIITDLHIGENDAEQNIDYGSPGWNDYFEGNEYAPATKLRNAVNWINNNYNSQNIKLVFVLGDITASAEISELTKAKEILDLLAVPYVPLMGNHDVWPYISRDDCAPEEMNDWYYYSCFNPQYTNLANYLPNFSKYQVPVWDWEVDPHHELYYQAFAFDSRSDWDSPTIHFVCLDFNARDNAVWPEPGVSPEGDLHNLPMNDLTSSISLRNESDSRGAILYQAINPWNIDSRSETFFSDDANLTGNYIVNDEASAIRIVGNCTVRLHKAANYKGSIVQTSNNINNLSDYAYQFNDVTSSVKVSNGYLGGRLVAYSAANYGGNAETFIFNDTILYGNYVGNDAISSFKIYGPCKVTFYTARSFSGSSITFDVSAGQTHQSQTMPSGWNDVISSIKIQNCNSRGVVFYYESDLDHYDNNQLTLCSNDNDLTNNPTGWSFPNPTNWNDIISSLRIVGSCTASLYDNANYLGFFEQTGPGAWNLTDFGLNDEVSSIEIDNGYKGGRIELYSAINYGGSSENFIYRDPNLTNNYIGNDVTSSVKVYPGSGNLGCYIYDGADYTSDIRMTLTASDADLTVNGPHQWFRDNIQSLDMDNYQDVLIFAHHVLLSQWGNFSQSEVDAVTSFMYPYRNKINGYFCGHNHGTSEWDITYNNESICMGYVTDANKSPYEDGVIRLVKFRYNAIPPAQSKTDQGENIPTEFSIGTILPNPARDIFNIKMAAPGNRDASITLFDVSGRIVACLYQGTVKAGINNLSLNIPDNVQSGIYFIKIESDGFDKVEKLAVLR